MKNIVIVITLILSFTLLNKDIFAQKKNKNKDKELDKVSVIVEGLGCPFCAFGLEKKFKEIKGIKDINIEMETGEMTFAVPNSLELSMDAIGEQVTKAGYTPVEVNITRADGSTETTVKADDETPAEAEEGEIKMTLFAVSGNCGMCKARIEKTAKDVEGVVNAVWDQETKDLTLEFNADKVDVELVRSKIAASGHDTGEFKASQEVYESLPPCCMYDRD